MNNVGKVYLPMSQTCYHGQVTDARILFLDQTYRNGQQMQFVSQVDDFKLGRKPLLLETKPVGIAIKKL